MRLPAVCLILGLLILSGCANLPAVVDSLAKDSATFCLTHTDPWTGTTYFARTNIVQGEVTCDKLIVKSPGTTQLPVQVTPVPVVVRPVK